MSPNSILIVMVLATVTFLDPAAAQLKLSFSTAQKLLNVTDEKGAKSQSQLVVQFIIDNKITFCAAPQIETTKSGSETTTKIFVYEGNCFGQVEHICWVPDCTNILTAFKPLQQQPVILKKFTLVNETGTILAKHITNIHLTSGPTYYSVGSFGPLQGLTMLKYVHAISRGKYSVSGAINPNSSVHLLYNTASLNEFINIVNGVKPNTGLNFILNKSS